VLDHSKQIRTASTVASEALEFNPGLANSPEIAGPVYGVAVVANSIFAVDAIRKHDEKAAIASGLARNLRSLAIQFDLNGLCRYFAIPVRAFVQRAAKRVQDQITFAGRLVGERSYRRKAIRPSEFW